MAANLENFKNQRIRRKYAYMVPVKLHLLNFNVCTSFVLDRMIHIVFAVIIITCLF